MAAMMKYIGLESPDFRARLHELHENNQREDHQSSKPAPATPKGASPPPSPTPKSHNVRILARLEAYRAAYLALTPSDNFDTALYTSVQILNGTSDASRASGTASFRSTFAPQYCNKFGTVHGGALATLLDGVSQCATAVVDSSVDDVVPPRRPDQEGGGATKGLQVRYCRPLGVGEAVRIRCEVLKAGRSGGAVIRSTVRTEESGEVVAFCLMDKEGCKTAKL
ncbi:hypothetical protein Q7P37_009420 [Cladosporium fusiforme]